MAQTTADPLDDLMAARGASRTTAPEVTALQPDREQQFQAWAKANQITDVDHPDSHYDYRGFWQETNGAPHQPGDHFPDTYKQHGHPTFSVESKYSSGQNDGGRWDGNTFVPPAADPLDALMHEHGADRQADFTSSNEKDASGAATVAPDALKRFAGHYGDQVNPMNLVRAVAPMVPIPKSYGGGGMDAPANILRTAKKLVFPTEILLKSKDALEKGDYVTAARHFIDYVLPVLGPALEKPADEGATGDYAAMLGDALGLGTAIFGPEALSKMVGSIKTNPILKNPNAADRAAVAFGQKEGIPVDAATATGNPFVRTVQKTADQSLGGSGVGQRARAAQDAALDATGHKLADQSFPRSVTPEGAGNAITEALSTKQGAHETYANTAYDRLRALEAKAVPTVTRTGTKVTDTGIVDASGVPVTRTTPITQSTRLAVDLRVPKAQLKPIYDQLMREKDISPPMGAKGRALAALDRLMTAPDTAPVSVVDAALGDLKALDRATSGPGQGVVKQAVKNLDGAVQRAVNQAGPEAVRALRDGRAATVAKYETADVLDRIKAEPVQAYRQMTAPKDAGIDLLRTVQREVPQAMSDVARAYLDDLLNTATAEGGFRRTDKLWADWQKLGAETKKTLFPSTGQVPALDHFFLLAKRIGENPNPSGSGFHVAKTGEIVLLLTHPTAGVPLTLSGTVLSKMLHSPKVVTALTKGIQASRGSTTSTSAYTAAVAGIVRAANEAGVPIPAAADQTPASGTR